MNSTIIVEFGAGREYSFTVPARDMQHLSKDEAQEWLVQEFEDLECSPSNPVGKILLVDMILNVAKYGGEDRFKAQGEWAQEFAQSVAVALNRPTVRVNVNEFFVA